MVSRTPDLEELFCQPLTSLCKAMLASLSTCKLSYVFIQAPRRDENNDDLICLGEFRSMAILTGSFSLALLAPEIQGKYWVSRTIIMPPTFRP